jgi:GDP-mannose 4,6-dehydratase
MKKVLITGISGMVGSHLVDFLISNTNWEIHGLIRWRSDLKNLSEHFDRINHKDRVFLHYGDLLDPFSIQEAVKESEPDIVFHLAAQSFPKTSFSAPLATLDTNILGTCTLLEVLANSPFDPIIHVCSSSEVFGRVPKDLLPISENVPFHPASPYAISKIGTDLLGKYYADAFQSKTLITRMFTHTGPRRGDVFAESTFAKQIALIESGLIPPVVAVGNLSSLRTIADVRDAVNAYFLLVTKVDTWGEAFNIGGTNVKTVGEVLESLLEISTCKSISIEVDQDRLRPLDADLQVPDTTKFESATGWRPKISYEKTISDLLDYWRQRVREEGSGLVR